MQNQFQNFSEKTNNLHLKTWICFETFLVTSNLEFRTILVVYYIKPRIIEKRHPEPCEGFSLVFWKITGFFPLQGQNDEQGEKCNVN